MRSNRTALPAFLVLICAGLLSPAPSAADTASGLPTGKRQHKPVTISKSWTGHKADARRLKDPAQRRAALQLIDALETAKRRHLRGYDRSHRLSRGAKSRSFQHNQTDSAFLRDRARPQARGGNEVALEELTLAHEGLQLVKGPYNRLRRALGTRTDCVRRCDMKERRCQSRCRPRRDCACIMAASDCLLSEIRAKRCSSAISRAWPKKYEVSPRK